MKIKEDPTPEAGFTRISEEQVPCQDEYRGSDRVYNGGLVPPGYVWDPETGQMEEKSDKDADQFTTEGFSGFLERGYKGKRY